MKHEASLMATPLSKTVEWKMTRLILEVACAAMFALCCFLMMISITMRILMWTI